LAGPAPTANRRSNFAATSGRLIRSRGCSEWLVTGDFRVRGPGASSATCRSPTTHHPFSETAFQPVMTLILSGNRRSATISSPVGS
jgi:hypothetical protein